MPVRRRVDKEDAAHIGDGILLGCKKEGNRTFATAWVDLEGVMLSPTSLFVLLLLFAFCVTRPPHHIIANTHLKALLPYAFFQELMV